MERLSPMTVDEMFVAMETMRTTGYAPDGDAVDDDDAARDARSEREFRAASLLSTDPRVHRCAPHCPYVEINRDHTHICSISGVCLGQRAYNDPLTAGIVRGLDENGVRTCGGPQPRGGFRRRDPQRASEQAMLIAQRIEELDAAGPTAAPDATDDARPTDARPKADRPPVKRRRRRELEGDQLAELRRDARDTLDKLTSPKTRGSTDARAPTRPAPVVRSADDALDVELRMYVRRCQIAGSVPLLDDLSNIELNQRRERRVAWQRDVAHRKAAHQTGDYVRLRELAAALVVALWRCALRSAYMQQAKRASDNFRPYAAGVYFSMRRGVRLADGTTLVPRCAKLTDALPEVRAAHRGTATHTVHLSAHRGVSTLQKCVASVPTDHATAFFAEAIRAAAALERAAA
jgi:hypothetical protein